MLVKQKVYDHFYSAIKEKINRLQKILNELKESGANETKSTAGDKHETALAMLQIEQANVRGQLKEATEQLVSLQKINPGLSQHRIYSGSLIKTDKGYFFISIAAGKAVIDDLTVFAISPESPLGMELKNANNNKVVTVNKTSYTIESIE